MPELPEVETTRRGIAPYLEQQRIKQVVIRQAKLRWPIDKGIAKQMPGQVITSVDRRGKYLLLHCENGTALMHLGMSGCVRIVPAAVPAAKHDHVDIVGSDGNCLRFTDPRRFGALLWTTEDVLLHPLLMKLGPEPLSREFNAKYFGEKLAKRSAMIKASVMDSHLVVGVGNIYATESLFMAGIDPQRASNSLNTDEVALLVKVIKQVLRKAIKFGGTTLKDFYSADGKPGYFRNELQVYGRDGDACCQCGSELQLVRIAQRATVFCPVCQR